VATFNQQINSNHSESETLGSFKPKDKSSLVEIAEGDNVTAVVLPDRWGSSLKKWDLSMVTQ